MVPRGLWVSGGKRAVDILVSATALLALSPLMILIALWVRLDSPGSVFYVQQRVGRFGKVFRIHKFRTMVSDREDSGSLFTVTGDSRITRCGAWLRRTKLDELPQFYDVLRGRMSLVGPRPEVLQYVKTYSDPIRHRMLAVRPGITDYASIEFRHEGDILAQAEDPEQEYVNVILPRKLQLSMRYLNEVSMITDIRIVLRTIAVVLS